MATSTLTIAGSTVNRPASRIILDRWCLSLDRPGELEFTELACNMPGSFAPEAAVTLSIGGTQVFNGWIYQRIPGGFTRESGRVGYRCLDQKFRAYMIPITASDGTGTMAFNLPSTSPAYQSTASGLSVGTILSRLFAQHSTILGTIGVSTDATTATQLATLTVVPPDPVYLSGNRLWSQVDYLCQQWYGSKISVVIDGSGKIRVVDTTALTPTTLTFNTHPILLDSITEDTSECYTAVTVRGRSDVDGAYLSLVEGSLIDPHNAAGTNLEATWTIADFLTPKGASSTGAITTNSSTTITVSSDNTLETWAANYWSGIQAQISAIAPLSTAITGFETRRITANTALTAGGTSVITVDPPLASTGFTRYAIRGQPTGKSEAYRRLNIKNTYVAQHLVPQFNFAMKWSPSVGAVTQTWFPVGVVEGVSAGIPFQFPAQFEVIPYDGTTDGYIRFYQPWVSYFNSQADLISGGSAVHQAADIKILVPFSKGTMSTRYPTSGYSGTAYSRFNVQRELVREYSSWWDQGSTTAMQTLAQEIHKTVSGAVIEGQITYVGQYLTAMVPGAPIALNLGHESLTTSYEAITAPCRTVVMEWPQGSAGDSWITRLTFSTRRQMYSGDRLYVHPSFAAGGFLSNQLTRNMAAGMTLMGPIDATTVSPFGAAFGGQGQLTPEAASAMAAMKNVGAPTFAGAAVGGVEAMMGKRAEYYNPDITIGATFNRGELGAAQKMGEAEQRAQQRIQGREGDIRPGVAAEAMQEKEARAAEDVFAPGQRQAREAEQARQQRIKDLRETNFDVEGFP